MPRPDCAPCCNPIELARTRSSYEAAVLQILCAIQSGKETFVEIEYKNIVPARATINSATFNNTWQPFVAAPAQPYKLIKLINNSGIAVEFSFDGTNSHYDLLSQSQDIIDFGSDGLMVSSGIWVRGATASTGLVIFNGFSSVP